MIPPIHDGNSIAMLLTGNSTEEIEKVSKKFLTELTHYASNTFADPIAVGVSSIVPAYSEIRRAFLESVEVLKTKPIAQENTETIYYYDDIRAPRAETAFSWRSLEQEIKQAVDQCKPEDATNCIHRFIHALPSWVTEKQEISFRLNQFLSAILSVLEEAGLSMTDVFLDEEKPPYQELAALYHPEQLEDFFVNTVALPCIAVLEDSRKGNSPLVQIRELVQQKKGNITIQECSDQLGYRVSYIWRILKNHTGMSFAEFAAKEKLDEAKILLLETELSIKDISQQFDYTASQNFIRFFKRETGTTPGQYRKLFTESRESIE